MNLLLMLAFAINSQATTYFVDSERGSDALSGTAATISGSTGPWQTLTKLASINFQAGDQILLRCGMVWNETLRLQSSGSVASPILVGSYPAGCGDLPIISGAIAIPMSQWKWHRGQIFKANLPLEHITGPLTGSSTLMFTNVFSLQGGATYTARFRIRSSQGASVRAVLRQSVSPWTTLGFSQSFTANGAWQEFQVSFVAKSSSSVARLDFVLPTGISSQIDSVRVQRELGDISQLFLDGLPLNLAHFPNRGYDSSNPNSLFLLSSQDAEVVGAGSPSLTVGPELALPPGASLSPGTRIHLRPNAWTLDERNIASVSGSRITLDSPTRFPMRKGWGYFLVNQLWMLDQPGEWYYDRATKTVYLWMPEGGLPSSRVTVSSLPVGLNIKGLSNLKIESIRIANVETAVDMQDVNLVTLQKLQVSNTLRKGINANGAQESTISQNRLERIGTDGIEVTNSLKRGPFRVAISENQITDSGVRYVNGRVVSLPVDAFNAIRAINSIVTNNQIRNAAYLGILPFYNTSVIGNLIENSCLVLDDCGAIYVSGKSNTGIVLQNNIIADTVGGLDGKPLGSGPQAHGIYLDEYATTVQVIGNSISGATNGLFVHNANTNRLENNTVYGSRQYQMWIQDNRNDVRPTGNIFDNQFIGNLFFPTTAGTPSIFAGSDYGSTSLFGTYQANRYSNLFSPLVVTERFSGRSTSYTLSQWKAARTPAGTLRNVDVDATAINNWGYPTFLVRQSNVLVNGDLANGLTGWRAWNQTAPNASVMLSTSCVASSSCLQFSAGGSSSTLSSPDFNVVKDQIYRVSFDIKSAIQNLPVSIQVRRSSGSGHLPYGVLAPAVGLASMTSWQRVSFVFQSTDTVVGARMDMQIDAGQSVWMSNVEIIPVDLSIQSKFVTNSTTGPLSISCDQVTSNSIECARFIRFSSNQSVSWPIVLQAKTSEVIYARKPNMFDNDRDGIENNFDGCPSTPSSSGVNSIGCGIGETRTKFW